MFPQYKPAKLYDKSAEWYIYYSYRVGDTRSYKRFKERFDINRIKDETQKRIYGKQAIKFMNDKLASGFNPFNSIKSQQINNSEKILSQIDTVYKIITKDQSQSTKATYLCMKNRFLEFIVVEKLQQMNMMQVNIDTVNSFKKFMFEKALSPKTINSTIQHIGLFWDAGIQKFSISIKNPFRNVTKVRKRNKQEDDEDIYLRNGLHGIFKYCILWALQR